VCKTLLGGTSKQKHSESCRKRMSNAMAGYRRVSDAKERKRKLIEKALSEEEVNREKVQNKAESNSEKPIHNESNNDKSFQHKGKLKNPSNMEGTMTKGKVANPSNMKRTMTNPSNTRGKLRGNMRRPPKRRR
jgi:hypothetical protein